MKGNHLAARGVHGNPSPLLVRLLLHKTGHFVGFYLQALDHDVLRTTHGLDMQMIRQSLEALDQEAQEPLEFHTYRATDAAQRYPLHQQAFAQRSGVLRDKVRLETLDKLTPTVLALVILLAIVDVPVFLVLGRLTLWADVSNDHGF
jgi:hypothetical protein